MRLWTIVLAFVACIAVSQVTAAPRSSGPRLDVTFGRAGGVVLRAPSQEYRRKSFVPDEWLLHDGVADSSGRVYVLYSGIGTANSVLAGYDAEGQLNRKFGHDGVLALGVLGHFRRLALDSAGRIIVLGRPPTAPSGEEAVILRVLPGGRLDPAFGFGGLQRQGSPTAFPRDVYTDGSGGVLVREQSSSSPWVDVVFRLGPDGMPDLSYGDDGFAVVPRIGEFTLRAHTVDATGRFVALDLSDEPGDGLGRRYALVGLDPSGRPDTTFGEQGTRALDFGARPEPVVIDVGIDAMGRIVVFGVGDAPRTAPFIARYLSDGTPDATWSGTVDGVRDILTDGALPGTSLRRLTIGTTSYYADGIRDDDDHPRSPDNGDSVLVRVDDFTEQVWTSRTRRFKWGLQLLSARDGTVLALGLDRKRHRRRRVESLVRLRFD